MSLSAVDAAVADTLQPEVAGISLRCPGFAPAGQDVKRRDVITSWPTIRLNSRIRAERFIVSS